MGLPGDVLEQAADRLALLVGVALVLSVLATGVLLLVADEVAGARGGAVRPVWPLVVIAIVCGITLAVARTRSIPATRRLDVGLVALVAIAFGLAVFRHWLPYRAGDVMRGPPPMLALTFLFAALVPVRPRRMLIAALLAAASDPIGVGLAIASGNPTPPKGLWPWFVVPSLFGALLAWLISHVYGLGRSVTEARAMGADQLVERLGAGGMGEVWLARHNLLRRPAAIKLILRGSLGVADSTVADRILRRFELEAQATASLTSPHTIRLYDFGVADDRSFYYVMEHLDGLDLERLVREHGPLSPARTVHLLLQACHSLAEAHAAGVIHRDIKPANLFVCRRRGLDRDFVKVLDFGLVKRVDPDAAITAPADLTAEGVVTGTPTFLAPEMAMGERDIDGRADLYALGCVAYWMVTGRRVFERDTAMKILLAHAHEAPEPPSRHAPGPLPEALEALVLRCLEKPREARPQSVAELEAGLRAVPLAEAWTAEEATRWWAAQERGAGTGVADAIADTVAFGAG